MNDRQTISSLAGNLVTHVEVLGQVLLYEGDWEEEIKATLTLIDDTDQQIRCLRKIRDIERVALIRIKHWDEARTKPVSEWCRGFIRGWLKTQPVNFDAYTLPADEPFSIGTSEEVIEKIFADRRYGQAFDNYSKAVRICQRYDWLTEQIKQMSGSQQTEPVNEMPIGSGSTTVPDEKQTQSIGIDPADQSIKQPQRRPSTLAREQRLKQLVEDYMKLEGKRRPEAMRLAAEKEGCGLDTVERAVGWKKR
ncbi:MAG: hypothetical protein JWP57_3703 [Spirosoma sp.]|nr:hypothetical protein [Spirosoma sp.]